MATLEQRLTQALNGRYTVERELGGGGTAVVYLARAADATPVAIKVLRPELASVVGWERFRREVEFAGRLSHPNILSLIDSGRADGLPYAVFPFLQDGSLRDLLRVRQCSVGESLDIVRQVAAGLAFAHRGGVVHRDIKPDNLLVQGPRILIADLGLARAIEAAAGDKLTATGTILGTPAYMSPEQATGSRDLDGRSDIYSLGCVLYEMLTGRLLFAGATPEEIIRKRFGRDAPGAGDIGDPAVAGIFRRMVARRPADRFPTADDLLAQLGTAG